MNTMEVVTQHKIGAIVARSYGGQVNNRWYRVASITSFTSTSGTRIVYELKYLNGESTENATENTVMSPFDLSNLRRALKNMLDHAIGGPVETYLPQMAETVENVIATVDALLIVYEEMTKCEQPS